MSRTLQDIIPRLLEEANGVAQSCFPGVKRLSRTGPAPDHKPSILQDYELGRAMEIDALVRAPAAFARAAGLSTPMLDFMAALAIRMARTRGCIRGEFTSSSGRLAVSPTETGLPAIVATDQATMKHQKSKQHARQGQSLCHHRRASGIGEATARVSPRPARAGWWSPISGHRATGSQKSRARSTASR